MKTNEVFFNELSSHHPAGSRENGDSLIYGFAECGSHIYGKGFTVCRTPDSHNITIAPDFSLADWMAQASGGRNRQIRDFFYSFLRHPFEKGDEESEIYFMERQYRLDEPGSGFEEETPEGLAWADIYGTFALSLKTLPVWNKEELSLSVTEQTGQIKKRVKHISDPGHLDMHSAYIEEMTPAAPEKTALAPDRKAIHLRKDHGVNILNEFAKKLTGSEYVTEIINSIPFCSACSRFIRKVYPDGKIEMILTWYDTGYGLIAQTTGKTLRETAYIADILEKDYGHR